MAGGTPDIKRAFFPLLRRFLPQRSPALDGWGMPKGGRFGLGLWAREI